MDVMNTTTDPFTAASDDESSLTDPPASDRESSERRSQPEFVAGVSGGTAPVSAIAAIDGRSIAVISEGVARWLGSDGRPGARIGGEPRCAGRAVALAASNGAVAVLHDDPSGLALVGASDHYLAAFDGLSMPVRGGQSVGMTLRTIAIVDGESRIYIFDRKTMAIVQTVDIPGVEYLAGGEADEFWGAIPRTGRLVKFDRTGALVDAVSGFGSPGVPAVGESLLAVPDHVAPAIMVHDRDSGLKPAAISGPPLLKPTGVILLPDGALLVSQEIAPYLIRYEASPS